MARSPCDITTLQKLFKTLYPNEMIYAIGTTKISHKNLPYGALCFQTSFPARCFYHLVVVHILNYCGLLYDNIVSIYTCSGLAGAEVVCLRDPYFYK